MSPDFNGTTSRRALILGMTNTDQIGQWQARAPAAATIPDHAERLDDAGDGGGADLGDAGAINEATGLTAEDQALFDGMQTGDTPAGGEPAGDAVDSDADPDGEDADADPVDGDADAPAAGPLGKEKTPEELAADAAAGKKSSPKSVSFGRYQRELKKASDALTASQAGERKARDDAIKLAERVAIINEALSAQPAPAVDPNAPPTNPFEEEDIDPTVDYAASVLQERRRNKFVYETSQGIQQDATISREDQHVRDTFQRDIQTVAATDPSAWPAYQFLKDSRLTEICISEFDKDPNDPEVIFTRQEVAKMVQIFNAEEKWVVGNAIKAGKSPTAAIMKLARARGFKYAPPAAAAADPAPAARAAPAAPRNGTGRALPAPAAPTAAEALVALAAAKEAGKSLSDGGGAPPSGLTAEVLLRMDDDEFAELIDGLPKHQLDALMGRSAG